MDGLYFTDGFHIKNSIAVNPVKLLLLFAENGYLLPAVRLNVRPQLFRGTVLLCQPQKRFFLLPCPDAFNPDFHGRSLPSYICFSFLI